MTGLSLMRYLVPGGVLLLLAGCAQKGPAPLYLWETFPRQQYDSLLRGTINPAEQIRVLEAQAEKARAVGAALPPGFRAHLGMLYLSLDNTDKTRQLWLDEKTTFPESAPYMDQLLKRLDASTKTANGEKTT